MKQPIITGFLKANHWMKASLEQESEYLQVMSNAMRVTINDIMMGKDGYFIGRSESNSKSQDIWIKTDTPIMCVKNDKEMELKMGRCM